MTGLKVHVGDGTTDFANRFTDAWRRAERSETVDERHLSFDSFEAMTRVLTPQRLVLLRRLHRHPTADICALALAVGAVQRYMKRHFGSGSIPPSASRYLPSGTLWAALARRMLAAKDRSDARHDAGVLSDAGGVFGHGDVAVVV